MRNLYPENVVMVILKPLCGIPEPGTHWHATYSEHHKEKLSVVTSTFDPYLLITKSDDTFGIVGMQTDDKLIFGENEFSTLGEEKLIFAIKHRKDKYSSTNLFQWMYHRPQ